MKHHKTIRPWTIIISLLLVALVLVDASVSVAVPVHEFPKPAFISTTVSGGHCSF